MIPNVFVSSTIQDLHYLRDAIRDALIELSYNPVMSEYGDVGYLPMASAESSCYIALRQCQLAILIVGKRYGSLSGNDLSVTHNEFSAAREQKLPVITLVDAEVMSFKKVFDANTAGESFSAPGMDAPRKTFEFISQIAASSINNGILTYSSVADARQHLKRQLAHVFGEFLRGQFDPVKADVKDILSELKTLRHELGDQRKSVGDSFLRAMRFLVDDAEDSGWYRDVVNMLAMDVDDAVPALLASDTFDEFVSKATDRPLKLIDGNKKIDNKKIDERLRNSGVTRSHTLRSIDDGPDLAFGATPDGQLVMNQRALDRFRQIHTKFRRVVEGGSCKALA